MKYGVKWQYKYGSPQWAFPLISFSSKYTSTDGSFITDDINEAYHYKNQLDLDAASLIWWVEEKQ